MDEFIIKSEKGITLSFHSPIRNKEGILNFYTITINASNSMQADIQIENTPYGTFPDDFFENLSANWKGWKGKKEWGAIEGEFDMQATSDSVGHVELFIRLRNGYYPPFWNAEITFNIEAGNLEKIAKDAKKFFEYQS